MLLHLFALEKLVNLAYMLIKNPLNPCKTKINIRIWVSCTHAFYCTIYSRKYEYCITILLLTNLWYKLIWWLTVTQQYQVLKICQQKNQNLIVVLNIVLHYLRNIQIRPFLQSLKWTLIKNHLNNKILI